MEKHEALNHLRVSRFQDRRHGTSIAFSEPVYSVFPGGNPEYDTHVIRYNYQSLITPSSVFDYDMATRASPRC